MINSYPLWKYFVVFLILIIGCVYSLPNLYGEYFVVSVTKHVSNNQEPDDVLLCRIKEILKNEKIIYKSIFLRMNDIQINFFSESDQLYTYKVLSSFFSEKYSISCNKISSVPNWLSSIKAKPMKLGLDLKGGLYLVIRVDMTTILYKFQEQYIDAMKSTLNKKNIPYVKTQKIKKYDIEIIFQNSNDRNQAISFLSKKYNNLIFNIINTNKLYITFSDNYVYSICEDVMQQNFTILRHRVHQLKISDPIIQRYGVDRITIMLPGIQDIDKIKTVLSNTASLEFRLVNTEINKFKINNNLIPEDSEIKLDSNGNIVLLFKQVILTGDHIISSDVNFDEYNRPQVNISLDKLGSAMISKFTKDNIGKLMATLFIEYKDTGYKDSQGYPILYKYDKVINIATIQSQLNHNFCIVGINSFNEVRYLSSLLRMGSLAAPIYIEEERIIGSTLGKKNITQGIIACGLGILISVFFMVIWYRYFGLIAGAALIANLILIVGSMSLIPGIMLTMPSIAGIVLTLSVAIDANVLINERIKEEIKQGKPIQYAIYMGYRKAFTSIVDANITTIITAVILYIISTDPIQGFAMTMIIGVGTSMFTSIIGTRTLVNLIYGKRYIKKLSI